MANIPRVFVSSTWLDNEHRRRVVHDAIVRAGAQPVGMEWFAAESRPALDVCLAQVRKADALLLILAWRYGFEPPGQDRSITELEYEAARAAKLPRFVFFVSPKMMLNPEQDLDPGPSRGVKMSKLDAFKARVQAEVVPSYFTDLELGSQVVQTLMQWQKAGDDRGAQPNAASRPAVETPPAGDLRAQCALYVARARDLFGHVSLAGFETRIRVPIRLEELYVPLHAMQEVRSSGAPDPDGADKAARGAEFDPDLPLTEAFRRMTACGRKGLVVLGHPGAGKTTGMKRLLLWLLTPGRGPESLGLPEGTLPVFVPLRNLLPADQALADLIDRELAEPSGLAMPAGFGRDLLARGKLLLLIDGLDEVPGSSANPGKESRRAHVARWVELLARTRADVHAVVTSRYFGYQEEGVRLDAQFLELHLRPLSQEAAADFVHRWFATVETKLFGDTESIRHRARQQAQALVTTIESGAFHAVGRVAALAHNPLTLTAICLVHRDRGRLPHRRVELYQECVNVLTALWREAKQIPPSFELSKAKKVLQKVAAFLHQQEGRTSATEAELTPTVARALADVQETMSAAEFLYRIRDESGILTGIGADKLAFLHLGFQEYLTARDIRDRVFADPALLAKYVARFKDNWWHEVGLLLVALDNPPLFAKIAKALTRRKDLSAFATWIGQALADAVQVPADLRDQLLAKLRPRAEEAKGPRSKRTKVGGVEVVEIEGGVFVMGSPANEKGRSSDETQHEVELDAFYLGKYAVTNEEYAAFLAAHAGTKPPSHWSEAQFNQPRQPVVGASWDEARAFCQWVGGDLPTEAQWEYACRAGTTTRYFSGNEEADLARVGWYGGNAQSRVHAVGELPANAFGLCDTHGNVWEWCADWYGPYETKRSSNPGGPERGSGRVIRGGGYWVDAAGCRSACRSPGHPVGRGVGLGFRVALPRPSLVIEDR